MRALRGWLFIPAFLFLPFSSPAAGPPFPVAPESEYDGAYLPGGHRGPVTALVPLEDGLALSAGADGFMELWDTRSAAARERYQLSPYTVEAVALRPDKPQISLIESDGMGLYRISAWDYRKKKRLFILQFRDPVSYIGYSARGNFLIAARSGRTGVAFIESETGNLLPAPEGLTGQVNFAVTGRSERSMIACTLSGTLSYWDLESGAEIRRFAIPGNIVSPVLFGGGRYLAGFDGQGLLVLDAVSGTVLLRHGGIRRGILLPTDPELSEFACLPAEEAVLYFFTVNSTGALGVQSRLPLPFPGTRFSSAAAGREYVLLGTGEGEVWLFPRGGGPGTVMATEEQERIGEFTVSPSTLAFLTGKGAAGFIPPDYEFLEDGRPVRLGPEENYTHITAGITAGPGAGDGGTEYFILWQTAAGRNYPLLETLFPPGGGEGGPGQDHPAETRRREPLRIPPGNALRGVNIFADRALLLDSAGAVTVVGLKTGEPVFRFSSVGSLDAAFLNRENLIIGRSAVSGNSPFLMINTVTGETVPLSPASSSITGAKVYRGTEGSLYGVIIEQGPGGTTTCLLRLNTANPARSVRLAEHDGEDPFPGITEAGGVLASTLGGEQAALYHDREIVPFERSPGLPHRLAAGGEGRFIILDREGNIVWHNPGTGEILAILRIFGDRWILEAGESKRQGPVIREGH